MLVSLGFALGTNRLGGSFTNSNNTLGMLESLGFASGLSFPLGIITTLIVFQIYLMGYLFSIIGELCAGTSLW